MDNYYHVVLDALTKATSQNVDLLKVGEEQLSNWETEKGFFSILLDIAYDTSIDVNIRWFTAVYIKNGIERYWGKPWRERNFADGENEIIFGCVIADDEKETIRQKLLCCLNEPVHQIALQFALIISQVAKNDYPYSWSDLFLALQEGVKSSKALQHLRSLLTLHHVVKVLASKDHASFPGTIEQVAKMIFSDICHMWKSYTWSFFQVANSNSGNVAEILEDLFLSLKINEDKPLLQEANLNSENMAELMERSLFTLKILRKLLVCGIKDFSEFPAAVDFLSVIFEQVGPLLNCRKALQGKDHLLNEKLEKYLVLLIKVLNDVLVSAPYAYVPFIRRTLECCSTFCFGTSLQDLLFEKLTVKFLNLIKSILLCEDYIPGKFHSDVKKTAASKAHQIKAEFFTLPVTNEICDQLLSRYFLLSETDIKNWENSPEDFDIGEDDDSWKFCLRPCTEKFFLALLADYRNDLTSWILVKLQEVQCNDNRDLASILKKDAVYNVIGLASFRLDDNIDFDDWFPNTLMPELRIKDPGYHIIRRRVIWLVGHWIGARRSSKVRPQVYEIMVELLDPSENLLVRFAAAAALKRAVKDRFFTVEQFLPFLERSIASLYILLKDLEEYDLKKALLIVMTNVLCKMGSEIQLCIAPLVDHLQHLWLTCGDHDMLRSAIIDCFRILVQVLGSLSENMHSFLIPMIAFAIDVNQPSHIYLMEYGIGLWSAVMNNTSHCSPDLLNLASNVLNVLDSNVKRDIMGVCFQIVEAYLVLSAGNFLKQYGQTLVETLLSLVKDPNAQKLYNIHKVIDIVFIQFPEEGPILLQPLLLFVLNIALATKAIVNHVIYIFSAISRIILNNPACFGKVLQEIATDRKEEVGDILKKLLENWLHKMSIIDYAPYKKLNCFALTYLLSTNSEVVFNEICRIFRAIVEGFNILTETDDGSDNEMPMPKPVIKKVEQNLLDLESDLSDEKYLSKRRREIEGLDPVYTMTLREYFQKQMLALQQSVGESKYQDLMSRVDVETMSRLQSYLNQ